MAISKGYDDVTLKKVQKVQLEILKQFIEFCDKHDLEYFLVYGSALGAIRHKAVIPWDDDIDVGMLREDYEKFVKLFSKEKNNNLELLTPEINEHFASRVTHLQKKGTTFISEYSKDLKCHTGINIDIFVYDKVSNNLKKRKKQFKYTFILGKLLFLKGTGRPLISNKGIVGKIYSWICLLVHHFLNLFGISAKSIYVKLKKYATIAKGEETQYRAIFSGYFNEFGVLSLEEDIFPLKKVPYEDIEVNVVKNIEKYLVMNFGEKYMDMPPEELRVNHFPYKVEFGEENE